MQLENPERIVINNIPKSKKAEQSPIKRRIRINKNETAHRYLRLLFLNGSKFLISGLAGLQSLRNFIIQK